MSLILIYTCTVIFEFLFCSSSIYIYIYIYMCVCMYIYSMYIYTLINITDRAYVDLKLNSVYTVSSAVCDNPVLVSGIPKPKGFRRCPWCSRYRRRK